MRLSNEREVVGKMRRFLLLLTVVGSIAGVAAGAISAATDRGIVPFVASGNPACSELSGVSWSESVKFSPPVNGSNANGVHLLVDGNTFQWFVLRDVRDLNVRAVIVKGGKTSNVYVYPGGDYSDGGLSAPTNPKNGKPADLGAVTVCFDPAS
jgi:hypothetical protein